MNSMQKLLGILVFSGMSVNAMAHYPFIAPLSYQTFNHNTAVLAGFYDNPFASEVAIKNFKFHFHTPTGEKIYIEDDAWAKTKTVASYSLEHKLEGTYRIRGDKTATKLSYAQVNGVWKTLIKATPKPDVKHPETVVYEQHLPKNAPIKTVQALEIVETFVTNKAPSNKVIHHIHSGFDVQFLSHPSALKVNQPIQFKVLDDKQGIAKLDVKILAQTTDYSRDEKVYQSLTSNQQGELNFSIKDKGQYLLVLDYQQPFDKNTNDLKRYKYTLAFNVID